MGIILIIIIIIAFSEIILDFDLDKITFEYYLDCKRSEYYYCI